jgi:tRNA (cytidine/uridine-2'-O-)-methyltransferase
LNNKIELNIVLVHPEIPQNTGNIIRLCANTGANLYLVKPLGFKLDNANLRRAYLDYSDLAKVEIIDDLEDILSSDKKRQIYCASTDGSRNYTDPNYQSGDTMIFGSESIGLPRSTKATICTNNQIFIPMMPNNRSLNLSNAVSVVVYEMWRQLSFHGSTKELKNMENYFS